MNFSKERENNYFDSVSCMSDLIVKDIINLSSKILQERPVFNIVLTGGKSFKLAYQLLAQAKMDWEKWHFFVTDERHVPTGSKDRNDTVIIKNLTDKITIPSENLHFIKYEKTPSMSAANYRHVLSKVDIFDLVLLSMGEDGHVASLFPDQKKDADLDVIVINNSPKYPSVRITMSYDRLSKSENMYKVVCGKAKKLAFESWLTGANLPIKNVSAKNNKTFICLN